MLLKGLQFRLNLLVKIPTCNFISTKKYLNRDFGLVSIFSFFQLELTKITSIFDLDTSNGKLL